MAAKMYSLTIDAEPRQTTIDRCCEYWPDFAAQIREEAAAHPGELPVLRRDAVLDIDETLRARDGYKHYKPGASTYLAWASPERKEGENG